MLTLKNENDRIELQVILRDEQGKDVAYWTEARVCANPSCDCGSLGLAFREEGGDGAKTGLGPWIDLDVTEKRLLSELSTLSPKAAFLAGQLVQNLDDKGWQTLFQYHWLLKRSASRRSDPAKVDFEFSEAELTGREMVPYTEVFLYEKLDFPDVDGQSFILDDTYCLDFAHTCTTPYMCLVPIDKAKLAGLEPDTQSTVGLDYATGEWENVEHGAKAPLSQERWVSLLRERDPELRRTLKERHERLRAVCRRFLSKRKLSALPDPAAPRKKDRPGPNSPCPCGSGKKYKKCCGKRK